MLQAGQQADGQRARIERAAVGVPVRESRQHPAFRLGGRRCRAEGHPGQQTRVCRIGNRLTAGR